jgi:hypothetical protein
MIAIHEDEPSSEYRLLNFEHNPKNRMYICGQFIVTTLSKNKKNSAYTNYY